MDYCLPLITSVALFTALVILDLYRQEFSLIIGHILFGFATSLGMLVLCQRNSQGLAWMLLALPLILVVLGLAIKVIKENSQPPIRPEPTPLGPGGGRRPLGPGSVAPGAGSPMRT